MIDSNNALIDEFIKREMFEIANVYVGVMIFDTYYTFNKVDWVNQETKQSVDFQNIIKTERKCGRNYLLMKKCS